MIFLSSFLDVRRIYISKWFLSLELIGTGYLWFFGINFLTCFSSFFSVFFVNSCLEVALQPYVKSESQLKKSCSNLFIVNPFMTEAVIIRG